MKIFRLQLAPLKYWIQWLLWSLLSPNLPGRTWELIPLLFISVSLSLSLRLSSLFCCLLWFTSELPVQAFSIFQAVSDSRSGKFNKRSLRLRFWFDSLSCVLFVYLWLLCPLRLCFWSNSLSASFRDLSSSVSFKIR